MFFIFVIKILLEIEKREIFTPFFLFLTNFLYVQRMILSINAHSYVVVLLTS